MKLQDVEHPGEKTVLSDLLDILKNGPKASPFVFWLDPVVSKTITKFPAFTKTRAKGLKSTVNKIELLNKQLREAWDSLYKTCTHAEADLEFDYEAIENTYGGVRGYQYTINCDVCKQRLISKYTPVR